MSRRAVAPSMAAAPVRHAQNDRSAFWEKPLRRDGLLFTKYVDGRTLFRLFHCKLHKGKNATFWGLSAGVFPKNGYKVPMMRNTHTIYTILLSRLQALFVIISQNFFHSTPTPFPSHSNSGLSRFFKIAVGTPVPGCPQRPMVFATFFYLRSCARSFCPSVISSSATPALKLEERAS